MGTNPIGPEGPHGSDDTLREPVTTKNGAAAQKAKVTEGIGPTGPHSAPMAPTKPADTIGPEGPHNP
jgi:hypothetical protein